MLLTQTEKYYFAGVFFRKKRCTLLRPLREITENLASRTSSHRRCLASHSEVLLSSEDFLSDKRDLFNYTLNGLDIVGL
jgi:hypothetical protein